MNNLSIVGRIGKVGELRYTSGGKAVINFSVATDNGKSNGEKNKPTWFEVSLWEKQAESLAEYLVVGDRIGVTGQVDLKVDNGKNGEQYHKLVISFARVELMGNGSSQETTKPQTRAAAATAKAPVEVNDEDIPF